MRLFPVIFCKKLRGTDEHFHFYYINLIKKNGNKLPRVEKRVLGGSNKCTYPFFYHWLLSFLSHEVLVIFSRFSGFFYDILSGLMAAYILFLIQDISFFQCVLFLSLYIIAPGITFSFVGPRAYSLTPRNFSQFIFCAGCFFLILCSISFSNMSIVYFIFASFFFSMLLLSSQFGTQVLFFMFLNVIAINNISSISASVVMAVIFSKGFFISQVKSQYQHLKWYFKYNYVFVKHKTNFFNFKKCIKEKNIRGLFYEMLFFNQIFTTLLRHQTFFIAILIYFLGEGGVNRIQIELLHIVVPLLLAFCITNFGKGRVFGEAERYIEFAHPLQLAFFTSLIPNKYISLVLGALFIYYLLWYAYNLYQIKSQVVSNYNLKNLTDLLKIQNPNLLCLSNNESYSFLRFTNVNIVGFLVNISLEGKYEQFFKSFFLEYPFVNPGIIEEICNKYNVTNILKNRNIKNSISKQYDDVLDKMEGFHKIHIDDKFELYERITN